MHFWQLPMPGPRPDEVTPAPIRVVAQTGPDGPIEMMNRLAKRIGRTGFAFISGATQRWPAGAPTVSVRHQEPHGNRTVVG